MSATRRLTYRSDFARVLSNRCRVRGQHFEMAAARNDLLYPRLGLSVSRRVSSKAVVRNRLKRQIRESFRAHQARVTGLDLIVFPLPTAARATAADIMNDLARLWLLVQTKCSASSSV